MLRPVNGVTCEVITSCGLHKFQARNPFYWPRAVDFLKIRPRYSVTCTQGTKEKPKKKKIKSLNMSENVGGRPRREYDGHWQFVAEGFVEK